MSEYEPGGDQPLSIPDEAEDNFDKEVPCMLLPLLDEFILVPTVTVAEMAPIQPFDIIPSTPDWFLGYYPWRNVRVPVISFETINERHSPKLNARGRVAVLNNTGISDKVPFIGLLTQNIPRMTRVEEKDIVENEGAEKRPFDLMAVKVGMEDLVIPDIAALERAVLDLNLGR